MRTIAELQYLQKLCKQLGALDAPGPALRHDTEYELLRQYILGLGGFSHIDASFQDAYSKIYDSLQREMVKSIERGNWIPVEVALPRADGDNEFAGSFPRSKSVLVIVKGQKTPLWGHYSIMGGEWVIENLTIVGNYPIEVIAWQEIAPYEQK